MYADKYIIFTATIIKTMWKDHHIKAPNEIQSRQVKMACSQSFLPSPKISDGQNLI